MKTKRMTRQRRAERLFKQARETMRRAREMRGGMTPQGTSILVNSARSAVRLGRLYTRVAVGV